MPRPLDLSGVVIFKDPVARNPHTHWWWAERGRIHFEDQTTGEYNSKSVKDTLESLRALSEMVRNSKTENGYTRSDECRIYRNYIDAMIELCQKAARQGMPDNPAHAKQKTAETVAKRQSKVLISNPGDFSSTRRRVEPAPAQSKHLITAVPGDF